MWKLITYSSCTLAIDPSRRSPARSFTYNSCLSLMSIWIITSMICPSESIGRHSRRRSENRRDCRTCAREILLSLWAVALESGPPVDCHSKIIWCNSPLISGISLSAIMSESHLIVCAMLESVSYGNSRMFTSWSLSYPPLLFLFMIPPPAASQPGHRAALAFHRGRPQSGERAGRRPKCRRVLCAPALLASALLTVKILQPTCSWTRFIAAAYSNSYALLDEYSCAMLRHSAPPVVFLAATHCLDAEWSLRTDDIVVQSALPKLQHHSFIRSLDISSETIRYEFNMNSALQCLLTLLNRLRWCSWMVAQLASSWALIDVCHNFVIVSTTLLYFIF